MKNNKFRKLWSTLLVVAVMVVMTACSNPTDTAENAATKSATGGNQDEKKIINIGVTYAPGTINPLSPTGEVATSVTGLMFLPLLEIDSNMEFQPMLADSIETSDNKVFTIKINQDATWTDGQPVTSDDVIYTIKQMANPSVGSIYAYIFAMFEGFDEYGYITEGTQEVPGIVRIDDKTLQLVAKEEVSLITFNNSVARYLWTIPEHILKEIAPDQLVSSEFFLKPDVTNGPFTLISYDRDHYVQLAANEDYFKGAPEIDQLNFNVLQASQLYPRLKSGEIDFNLPTLGILPSADYENVKALENVTTILEEPIANQYVYINESVVPDPKTRLAFVYAINRQQIVDELLKGNGEVINGFFTSYSPYYDETLVPTEYNPEKAKQLLAESAWDSTKELTISVSSGDDTLAQAANIVAANLNAAGVKVKIKMTDFNTLINELYSMSYDLGILQYSFTPVDPYPDLSYLLQEGNVNGYSNKEVNELLAQVKSEDEPAAVKELYARINKIAEVEVPMFSVYATRSLAAVSNRVTGVTPRAYGTFINVHEWDIAQ
ncbi:MAG: extracellular solute-binding protein family 5 [Lachnospiraceae bacterium]|jgi:peptide/nickel transport system substrate-binding protein|nr:extracellular solute-binding protein family 5 [Lachnospiraceae bacterium]